MKFLLGLLASSLWLVPFQILAQDQAPSAPGPVTVEVRIMTDAELRARYDMESLTAAGAGVFSLPRSLSGAVAASGNMASAEGPPSTLGYSVMRDVVMGVIGRATFPIQVDGALRQRLGVISKPDGIPASLAVAIGFYGVQSRDARPTMLQEGEDFCFVFRAVAVFDRDGPQSQERKIDRGTTALSPDMPAPRCASMRDLTATGGAMLRELMRDAAETAADWIVANVVQRE